MPCFTSTEGWYLGPCPTMRIVHIDYGVLWMYPTSGTASVPCSLGSPAWMPHIKVTENSAHRTIQRMLAIMRRIDLFGTVDPCVCDFGAQQSPVAVLTSASQQRALHSKHRQRQPTINHLRFCVARHCV